MFRLRHNQRAVNPRNKRASPSGAPHRPSPRMRDRDVGGAKRPIHPTPRVTRRCVLADIPENGNQVELASLVQFWAFAWVNPGGAWAGLLSAVLVVSGLPFVLFSLFPICAVGWGFAIRRARGQRQRHRAEALFVLSVMTLYDVAMTTLGSCRGWLVAAEEIAPASTSRVRPHSFVFNPLQHEEALYNLILCRMELGGSRVVLLGSDRPRTVSH